MDLKQKEYYNQFDTHKGVYYIQGERVEELNDRISSRSFPDEPLEPYYDPRPVPTKYAIFPMVDRRRLIHEPKKRYGEYKVDKVFAPVSGGPAPISGLNIEAENTLRNQYFALQRDTMQGNYIPSTKSDLYNVTIVSKPSEQPHKELFRPNVFGARAHPNLTAPEAKSIGNDRFSNHTRTQLRNTV